MKTKLSKIISSLLVLSFLLSMFTVFSFAEEDTGDSSTSTEESKDNLKTFINRGFEEGWDYNNGFNAVSGNKISIDYEEDELSRYNYFVRYEALNSSQVYTRINFASDAVTFGSVDFVPGTVIEMSLKADDLAYLGNIMWMQTAVKKKEINLLSINGEGHLLAFPGSTDFDLGALENEWLDIAYIFDWKSQTANKDSAPLSCKILYGKDENGNYINEKEIVIDYEVPGDIGMFQLYIGFPAQANRTASPVADSIGMSYCLDNLKVYQGVTSIVELDPEDYGFGIDTNAEKVINIQEGAGVKTKAQLLEEALALKVGVDYALAKNERIALVSNSQHELYSGAYGAPAKKDGNVLIPLQLLLDYIGFPSFTHTDGESFDITTGSSTTYITLGRNSATVDGVRVSLAVAPGYLKNTAGSDYLVIALEDVPTLFPGWLAIYDDMGLIIIYEDTTPESTDDNAPIVNRTEDLETMLEIMKKFVFDTVSAAKPEEAYVANGERIYNDAKEKTNNFAHPYIIANQTIFDKLKAAYANGDETVKAYIKSIVDKADAFYTDKANVSGGSYTGIKEEKKPVNLYADGKDPDFTNPEDTTVADTTDGYDANGKMDMLVEYASVLPNLAFAYQVTGNDKYARLAYDWSMALASWKHWGPGYFIQCSEVTSSMAIAYDWLYNAYKALSLDTDALASAIYSLGVHDGYVSSIGSACEHPRATGDMSAYTSKSDNTNAVGTAGMIIGALAVLDYVDNESIKEEDANAFAETKYLIGNNIQNLIKNGLDIYAPDGSYIESATYWEYGTSNFFRMVMALVSATGKDYGFMSTWGIDKTCYYACHIESSDGFIWNYHDGGGDGVTSSEALASLNTDMFNFVGAFLGDATLVAVRQQQLKEGKEVSVYDLIFYPFDGITASPELSLDYHMEGIEAFVSRSDWNDGALYTGLMGGMNSATNGQIDSGNFIYYNEGIAWIMDLGSENPGVTQYNSSNTRYKCYRASAEGQNVILITSQQSAIAYGQYTQAGGVITNTFSNEHGSYAILDNTSVYLDKVSYAKRGVLVTNDRSTVVLQDELSFKIVQSLAWVVHTAADITIDPETQRVAYLTSRGEDGEVYTLRASIVSLRPEFVFSEKEVTKPILDGTYTADKITGAPEYSRDGISRLVIESTTILFDVAVVFEMVENSSSTEPVGYEWVSMVDWEPTAPNTEEEVEQTSKKRGTPNKLDIRTATATAESILKRDTAFSERLGDLYAALTTVGYTLKTYTVDMLDTGLQNSYGDYINCVDEYEAYFEYVSENVKKSQNLVNLLVGLQLAEAEEPEVEE
jgi:hypothetical protein